MTKECKWVIKEASDAEKVERLSTEVGIDKVLADLLDATEAWMASK